MREARPAVVLVLIAVSAAAVLAIVQLLTQPRIDANLASKMVGIQKRVLPSADHFDELQSSGLRLFTGSRAGSAVGRVLIVESIGYGGPIDLVVGISDGQVTGVEVLKMSETPGFGEKVNDPEFTRRFIGLSASSPIEVGDDIDAVTGATISSRAISAGVKDAVGRERELE